MEILGTTKISYEIEQLLNNSEKYLVIVSPYLKLNQRLKVRLSDAIKKEGEVYFLYRENGLMPAELDWLHSFKKIHVHSIDNLHSKIYLNEKYAIIASMNLYEYSQINNHEIGVKLEFEKDKDEYVDVLNEIRIILNSEYEDNSFDEIIEMTKDYSMKHLYDDLTSKYYFTNKRGDKLYEFFSQKAMKFVKFDDSELYQDKTAILRATQLGKEKYEFLEKKLIELAK